MKNDVIYSKHVKFCENEVGYKWIYGGTTRDYASDHVCPEKQVDEEITVFDYDYAHPGSRDERDDSEDGDLESPSSEIAGATSSRVLQSSRRESRVVDSTPPSTKYQKQRSSDWNPNPYGRAGKPKDAEAEQVQLNLLEVREPANLQEALNSPHANAWKKAMDDEYESLISRGTWEETELPEGRKANGSRWVYKLKVNSEGQISRYKARLVAQGCGQVNGVDYNQTYAPVIAFAVLRLLLGLAFIFNWHVRHIDIKCAYLYGGLNEEIYMRLPLGYPTQQTKIVRLLKPIYGLKQSGRNWNEELDRYLTDVGYKRLRSCNCVYVGKDNSIIAVYVDDVVIFSKNGRTIDDIIANMKAEYELRDLGDLTYLLGVKIERTKNGFFLSQRGYIKTILKLYGVEDCRPASTPLNPGVKLTVDDCPSTVEDSESMNGVPYQSLIGSLMYLALYSRPDILFAVVKLSQFNVNPGRTHWNQAKNVLRYLSHTVDYALSIAPQNTDIISRHLH